ncbi:hypothetical protein RB593_000059 [Gaeumannomyces tritici]
MHALNAFGLLALLVGSAASRSIKDVTTLKPIPKRPAALQGLDDGAAVAPSTSVKLEYGLDAKPMVEVKLDMAKPTVLLEEVADVVNVTCSDGGLAVEFKSKQSFLDAVAAWAGKGDLVFFTNHNGACDNGLERGIYEVNKFEGNAEKLVVNASAAKKDVASTATHTTIEFKGVPAAKQRRSAAKRDLESRAITIDDKGLTIGGSIGLPAGMSIYSFPPYLSVTADSAKISAAVTFSGKVDYDVFSGQLKQLYIDIDSNIDAEIGVTIDVTASYRDSFAYSPGQLSYMIVDVPGIITLGPELIFGIGLDVDIGAGARVKGTAGAGLKNGRIHIDFLDQAKITATPWTPTHNAGLDLSQRANAKADAWIDVTFQLIVQVLGGVVDMTAGLRARPRFNNDFSFAASQTIGPDGKVNQPTDGLACAQGLSVKSDFSFSLEVFVSKLWNKNVYSTLIPIADKCYTWVKGL